jgi:hypothetical protein
MKRVIRPAATLFLAAAVVVVQMNGAEARKGRHARAFGIAAGVVGLGLLGAAAEAEAQRRGAIGYHGGCYPGPLECDYVERPCSYNEYGDQFCPAPSRRCYHREICE